MDYYQKNFAQVPGITDQSVKERLEITYKAKAIFAFLSSETKDMADIWKLLPDGRTQYMDYRSGMSMTIVGRRFVLYDKTSDLNNLLFMLLGKNDPICSFFSRSGGMGVYVGFPDNTLYKVESIYDCADSQLMYDSVNFLISREGHIGLHINTDVAIALKQQIELSMQRRMNDNNLLSGL